VLKKLTLINLIDFAQKYLTVDYSYLIILAKNIKDRMAFWKGVKIIKD